MDKLDIESISLEQALIDFEVANARVIDLTRRLTSLSQEVLTLRGHSDKTLTLSAGHNEINIDAATKLKLLRNSRVLKLALLFAPRARRILG